MHQLIAKFMFHLYHNQMFLPVFLSLFVNKWSSTQLWHKQSQYLLIAQNNLIYSIKALKIEIIYPVLYPV